MSIPAIGALSSLSAALPTTPTAPTGATAAAGSAGQSFGAQLASGLEQVQTLDGKADGLAVKAATGDLTNVHDYMIASTQATLATELTVAIRNKALDAFNEIMRMPM